MKFSPFLAIVFLAVSVFTFNSYAEEGYEKEVDLPQRTYKAFEKGEKVEYDIKYGMVTGGSARFKVEDTTVMIAGKPHYYVTAKGESNRFFDMVFKVRDHHFSYIDKETLYSTIYMRDTRQGSYDTTETIYFDRRENMVRSGDIEREVPPDIHGLLSAFYYSRGVDFTQFDENTKVNVKTFFAGDMFPVGAVVVGEEEVSTSYGTFECLVIEPILIPGRVFREQRDMRMWITKDKNQIPVKISSEVLVGRIRAEVSNTENLKYPLDSRVDN